MQGHRNQAGKLGNCLGPTAERGPFQFSFTLPVKVSSFHLEGNLAWAYFGIPLECQEELVEQQSKGCRPLTYNVKKGLSNDCRIPLNMPPPPVYWCQNMMMSHEVGAYRIRRRRVEPCRPLPMLTQVLILLSISSG